MPRNAGSKASQTYPSETFEEQTHDPVRRHALRINPAKTIQRKSRHLCSERTSRRELREVRTARIERVWHWAQATVCMQSTYSRLVAASRESAALVSLRDANCATCQWSACFDLWYAQLALTRLSSKKLRLTCVRRTGGSIGAEIEQQALGSLVVRENWYCSQLELDAMRQARVSVGVAIVRF